MLLRNFVMWTAIIYLGGLVFMYLEADNAKKTLSLKSEIISLKKSIQEKLNASEEYVNRLLLKVEKAVEENGAKEPYCWDYYESCFFVGSLVTTIGYGHIAPRTRAGQFFTMIYSLIGIPLTMLVLRNLSTKITNNVTKIVNYMFRLIENTGKKNGVRRPRMSIGLSPKLRRELRQWTARKKSRKDSVHRFTNSETRVKIACIIMLTLLVVLFIAISAVIRVIFEGWSFYESVYFWFITLTTVGFGDYVPYEGRKPKTLVKTIIYYTGTIYLLIGLALIGSLIQCISILLEGRLPAVSDLQEAKRIKVVSAETQNTKYSDEKNKRTSDLSSTSTRFSELPGETITHAVVECQAPFVGLFVTSGRKNSDDNE